MAKFKENGKLKLLIIVGTRPEIIRLAAVITKCREYFDCLLAHTGQNYDYNLNGVFFKDLKLQDPDIYMEAVGDDLGATMGNIIDKSYKVMVETKPDAVLVLGDTNSCLSVIAIQDFWNNANVLESNDSVITLYATVVYAIRLTGKILYRSQEPIEVRIDTNDLNSITIPDLPGSCVSKFSTETEVMNYSFGVLTIEGKDKSDISYVVSII